MGQIRLTNDQLGRLGETAVSLELMKKGYDVINLNESLKNYEHADLLCISRVSGKDLRIQVKTGSTNKIYCGLTATNKGIIDDLEEKVVCPWVFVHVTPVITLDGMDDFKFDFYILNRDETRELFKSSQDWYANQTKTPRTLQNSIPVSVDVPWLEAKGSKETSLHYAYKSTLKISSLDKWDKISL